MDIQLLSNIGIYVIGIIIGGVKLYQSYIAPWLSKKKGNHKEKGQDININLGGLKQESAVDSNCRKPECGNLGTFLFLLSEQNKIFLALIKNQNKLLEEQMAYFQKSIKDLRLELMNMVHLFVYKDLYNEEDEELDTLHFANFFDAVASRVEYNFRKICVENHFSQKTQKDFDHLLKMNISTLMDAVMGMVRTRTHVTKRMLKIGKEKNVCEKIKQVFENCLKEARESAIRNNEEKELMIKQYEELLTNKIGSTYEIDF